MKKVISFIVAILVCVVTMGQTVQPAQQKKAEPKFEKVDAKTFKAVSTKTSNSTASYTATGFFYQTKTGEKKEIYLHTKTRGKHAGETCCYVQTAKGGYREIPIKPEELK